MECRAEAGTLHVSTSRLLSCRQRGPNARITHPRQPYCNTRDRRFGTADANSSMAVLTTATRLAALTSGGRCGSPSAATTLLPADCDSLLYSHAETGDRSESSLRHRCVILSNWDRQVDSYCLTEGAAQPGQRGHTNTKSYLGMHCMQCVHMYTHVYGMEGDHKVSHIILWSQCTIHPMHRACTRQACCTPGSINSHNVNLEWHPGQNLWT